MIAILGAGAMGAALAAHLAREGRDVSLLATEYDEAAAHAARHGLPHPALAMRLPDGIVVVDPGEWPAVLADSRIVTVAVSTHGLAATIASAASHAPADARWAIATKGWEVESLRSSTEVAIDVVGDASRVVQLVGPSLAAEVAAGVPTGIVAACADVTVAKEVADAFAGAEMRVVATDDVAGVEVGSALKNVIAIAVGLCDGIAEHEAGAWTNTKAFLFARGLGEMAELATKLGGRVETILGLAGAGDLFVTCLGGRNGRFGRLVGLGTPPEQALREMRTTVEGYSNVAPAKALAQRHGVDAAVVNAVHAVLFEGVAPQDAIRPLVSGAVVGERI